MDRTISPVARDLAHDAVFGRRAFVRFLKDGPIPRIFRRTGRTAANIPEVTIIIPSADGRRDGKLAALLAQLKEQTFQQFEVIVVEGDRRQGRAINTAAAIARGDLLVIMDDDTRVGSADLVERFVRVFNENDQIGIAGVTNVPPDDALPLVRRAMRELPRRSSLPVSRIIDSDLAEHGCLAIRRSLFYRVGGEHELLPRGLDPYLRREVRHLGYRVVVIPGAWIHHLLPPTLRGILRLYFRNGMGAAYVKKFYPEFVIDQALDHQRLPHDSSFSARMVRYVWQGLEALVTLRWIYLGTLAAYAAG